MYGGDEASVKNGPGCQGAALTQRRVKMTMVMIHVIASLPRTRMC